MTNARKPSDKPAMLALAAGLTFAGSLFAGAPMISDAAAADLGSPFAEAEVDNSDWAGSFLVRLRASGVLPRDEQTFSPAVDTEVTNAVIPEVDLSYFITDNIAVETICCVSYHDVSLTNGAKIGETFFIPFTLLGQYHFHFGKFKPYVGLGPNLTVVIHEEASAPFNSFDLDTFNFGFATQIGADFAINERWHVNLDAKRYFLDLDANVNNGAVRGRVEIDPWIVSAGIGFKF